MIEVCEAKSKGLIPEAWHNVIPDSCRCGAPLVISENLKTTKCSNLKCLIKVANRAYEMLQNLGIKGMGESYCIGFFKQNGIGEHSHLAILTATPEEHFNYYSYDVRKANYEKIQEALTIPRTYRQVVSRLAFPDLGQKAYKLFKGCNSLSEAVKEMVSMSSEKDDNTLRVKRWITRKLGRGGEVQVSSLLSLIDTFAKELLLVNEIFNIIPDAKVDVVIAMTGSPTLSGMRKDAYISMLNKIAPELISVTRKDNESGVSFIIADSESNTSKYLYGKANNLLINSVEFKEYIIKLKDELEGGLTND